MLLAGCQSDLGRVVTSIKRTENIEALNKFVERVKKHEKAKVLILSYGIEGQRIEETLSFDGKGINGIRTVEGEFNEEYVCNSIQVEEEKDNKVYFLNACKGESGGSMDYPILSVSNR